MRKFSKLFGFIVAFFIIMGTMCSVSFAASVGAGLINPEDGWKRYEESDSNFTYINSENNLAWEAPHTYSTHSAGSAMKIGDTKSSYGAGVKFGFYGTKLRICHYSRYYESNAIEVKIDGKVVGTYDARTPDTTTCTLLFEITSLDLRIHNVEVINKCTSNTNNYMYWDAVDIDSTGYLAPYQDTQTQVNNLTAVSGNSKVDLSWDSVSDATSYNIYRSETSGTGYEKIDSTTAEITTFTDTSVTNGTTYYYVVTAVTASGESPYSSETSATPKAPKLLKLVLEVNEDKQLSVSNELSDNTELDWESSDSTIATVDANGKVKALKSGNTVITCTSKNNSYTESINVLVIDLEYQLAVDLDVGDKCRLTVDDLANATDVTWSSFDSTIATVTSKGKVTAVSEGLTYIVASDNDGNEIGRIYIRVRK